MEREAKTVRSPRDRTELIRVLANAGLAIRDYEALEEPLLTTSQVAIILRTTPRTVRNWADGGKIGAIRSLGGRRMFPASAVLAALESMVGRGPNTDADV